MGAHPYWYVVPHEDPKTALDKLRLREFKAGRYNPVMPFLDFPVTSKSPAPGAKHKSIGAALSASDADGTRSILDIDHICRAPEMCGACALSDDALRGLYGTLQPTREQVEEDLEFFEDIERGQAIYMVLYKDGQPSELLFAGYSFD